MVSSDKMQRKTKIVIVGAGAAGIAAASRLLQNGMDDFVVLEANDRIGGRIKTVDFVDNVVDLGAQWVHGQSGNVVFELASKHDLLGSFFNFYDVNKHNFVTISGEVIPKKESIEAIDIFETISERVPEDLKKEEASLGDYYQREYYKFYEEKLFTSRARAAEFLSWIEKVESSIECCDTWFDVSAKRLVDYWHCEGNPLLNWKDRGYITLFDLLLQKIPNGEKCLPVIQKVELGAIVTTIDYSFEEDVIVTTADGSQYVAPHVIFTGSLGVLKEKHSNMFVPALPRKKQSAIEGLNIGTVNKIFLEFSHKWWPEDMAAFDFLCSEESKKEFLQKYGLQFEWLCDVFSFYAVDYQPNVLCAWIVGRNARNIERLSDDEVFHGLCILLENSLGKHYSIVRPRKILRSKWFTDEHFRGSYSFQSMETELMNVSPKDLAEPIMKNGKPVILFAGEATHDHYYSTVHGAVETGFREADRLIDFHHRQLNLHL